MSQHTTSSRYHRYGKCGSLLSPLALAICLAVPAQAQVLEEVIVTAQKKSESLQDAPIAISAFTSERLEQMGTSTAADIGNFTPNAVIAPSFGSSNNIRATIRGVGTAEPSLAIDPKVGIYLDGVYIARNAGAIFDIVDLERVEVLRGPQGTLWGKNTTGGAVNLVTSKPAEEFGFKQQLSAGDFGYFKSVTTVDTGRHGDVSARVSYMRRETDGWATNYNPQSEKDLGSEDVEAVKFSVRWDVTDNFAIDYGYDQTNSSAVAMPVQVASVNSFAAANPAINTIALRPFAAPAFYDVGNVFTQMAALANNHDRLDKFYMDGTLPEHVDIKGHNLTMTWNVGDVELRSISAYREYDSKGLGLDLDGGTYTGTLFNNPLYGFQSSNVKSSQQASQEFQMLGELLDGDLDYVVGLYYFEEDGREDNPWIISFWVPTFGPSNIQNIGTWGNWFEMESQSQAIYGQFTYDFTDRLALTVGMRYTEDEKSLVISQRDPGILFDQKDSEDWDKFTGAVTLAYALTDDINVYGKVSEGYSAGVYNPGS
ncbi:MAG: TonB-dependent receptor, partial [Gammaproteobacteria bacterium]